MSIKYICIPYPPKFSRLRGENHPIKNGINRTKDIVNLNRYFKSLNRNSLPRTRVPTMEMLGVTEDAFQSNRPVNNSHIFEEWHQKDRKWPKDLLLAKDIVHLRYSARLPVWKGIHKYFANIY